jgi:hypothetical protein
MRLDFCTLCGEKDPAALEHHHFIPSVLGGSDEDSNMFTVCGPCHGKIHDIPRPLRLSELVKAGVAKAQERSAADYRKIAEQSTKRAETVTTLAKEAERKERNRDRAELRLVGNNDRPKPAKQRSHPSLTVVVPSPIRTASSYLDSSDCFTRFTKMQKDKQFRAVDNWALASDSLQWVLQRRTGPKNWTAESFVRTSKVILERCMREKGVPPHIAEQLLEGLPDDFEAWHDTFCGSGHLATPQTPKSVMTGLTAPACHVIDRAA